jgi:VanZ family protein
VPRAPSPFDMPRLRRLVSAALLGYLVLIVYGSLYPFSAWRAPTAPLFDFLTPAWPKYFSITDVAVNVVVYIPLGLMLAGLMRRSMGAVAAVVSATLLGGTLSLTMETLQMFLPGRVSSVLDLETNTLGTLIGALSAWALRAQSPIGRRISSWRSEWFLSGALVDAGLAILLLCLLAELAPLIPSLQGAHLYMSVMPLWKMVLDSAHISVTDAVLYGLKVFGLGMFVSLLVVQTRGPTAPFIAFITLAMIVKLLGAALLSGMPFYAWRVSSRAALGLSLGISAFWLAAKAPRAIRAVLALSSLLTVFVWQELAPGLGSASHAFNWIPFLGQMYGLTGILDIVSSPALFLAIGTITNLITPRYLRAAVAWGGGILTLGLAFALEGAQEAIPGRTADITDVLLFTSGWIVPWLWRPQTTPTHSVGHAERRPRRHKLRWLTQLVSIAALVALLIPLATKTIEIPLDEKHMYRLPAPEDLPPTHLPYFREAHPRLPAPTAEEIERLQQENPGYFELQEGLAKRGDIYPTILLARAFPGSQDLSALHKRLMALEIHYRGNNTELVALGYDWLYDQWTEEQRRALRDKVADGCDFIINLIRNDRLSPYNVYLYNSPFQRLMAASIALYHDDPRGELAMRFTYDMWTNRILPVWRQVMGKNGGWHEGGEYIALGIGQAVYELPALWRRATGEDYFKSEPGIRGFTDFILYRLRPDGTHFRIGDGNFTERIASDLIPLALEYRDSAAYSLHPPPRLVPNGWPWGPLSDASLNDPEAIRRKPLTKLLDGVGIVVARSDWNNDATYVTFKAGDNFWSHSHLDQGSFTIFKGGPLAIDSGYYGVGYGTDHHMNYTYQSIAHNLVTVTDPADTVAAYTRKGMRPIANDGGQRRVGSGWGVEPAPLDRDEWNAKREIYHTGTLEHFSDKNGIVLAQGDLTAAYTNSYSGHGTFSHRTRRVEAWRRTFGYDRIDDVIVVFDRVVATNPEFNKRWLLHTIEEPRVTDKGFTVSLAPQERLKRAGGTLTAYVLLPEQRTITAIGGKGREFFVDGKNYDEDGRIYRNEHVRNDPDGGAWRIEISPSKAAREDIFLTVLIPTSLGITPTHKVRPVRDGDKVGCEILGPHRTIRWLFDRETGAAQVDVVP